MRNWAQARSSVTLRTTVPSQRLRKEGTERSYATKGDHIGIYYTAKVYNYHINFANDLSVPEFSAKARSKGGYTKELDRALPKRLI